MRTADQIARRAVVMGSIAFRAALEVTDHPRTIELSDRLLPWLESLGIGEELDPIERELLATPYGRLRPEQRTDAVLAGEGAAVFGWAIGIAEKPPACNLADQNALVELLQILRPEVQGILDGASIRPEDDLKAYCIEVAAIRCELQQLRIDDEGVRTVLRNVLREKLAEIGLRASDHDLEQARSIAAAMSHDDRKRAAGLSFVREHALMWLFDSHSTYFAAPKTDEEERG